MVTAIDVARRAGVSQSAVSRAFTPGAPVAEATRARVLAVAAELGYRPNALARALITGQSRIVGVVAARIDDPPAALEALSRALQRRGRLALVVAAAADTAATDSAVAALLDYQVEGVLAMSAAPSDAMIRRCVAAGAPVVLFDGPEAEPGVAVRCDGYDGGRRLAHFLARRGDRTIGYIAGARGAPGEAAREAGFRSGLADFGFDLAARDAAEDHAAARAAVRRMAGGRARPDALCVADDRLAVTALDALRGDLGLDAPEDIAVVALRDGPRAAAPAYGITALRHPTHRMVAAALAALDGHPDPRAAALAGPILVRRSAPGPNRRTDAEAAASG